MDLVGIPRSSFYCCVHERSYVICDFCAQVEAIPISNQKAKLRQI